MWCKWLGSHPIHSRRKVMNFLSNMKFNISFCNWQQIVWYILSYIQGLEPLLSLLLLPILDLPSWPKTHCVDPSQDELLSARIWRSIVLLKSPRLLFSPSNFTPTEETYIWCLKTSQLERLQQDQVLLFYLFSPECHLNFKNLNLKEKYLNFIIILSSNLLICLLQPIWRFFRLLGTSICHWWGSK